MLWRLRAGDEIDAPVRPRAGVMPVVPTVLVMGGDLRGNHEIHDHAVWDRSGQVRQALFAFPVTKRGSGARQRLIELVLGHDQKHLPGRFGSRRQHVAHERVGAWAAKVSIAVEAQGCDDQDAEARLVVLGRQVIDA